MRRLVLLRHAKAVRPEPGMADFDRGLEPRGRVEAARAAQLLADLGLQPDVALVSPARRTRETWSVVSEQLTAGAVEEDAAIYEATAGNLLRSAAVHSEADILLMVGHNPGLKDLARTLMGEGPHDTNAATTLSRGLPTSCAVVLAIEGAPSPRLARLIALITPERDDD
jgi:phosphohistidine phosphatase